MSPRYFKNRVLTSYLFDRSNISFSLLVAQDLLCKFKTEKGIAKQALFFLLFSVWATVGLPPGYLQNQKVLGYKDDFWQATNDHFELNKYPSFFSICDAWFLHSNRSPAWLLSPVVIYIGPDWFVSHLSFYVPQSYLSSAVNQVSPGCVSVLTSSVNFTNLWSFFVVLFPHAFTEFFTSVYQEVSVQSCLKKGNKWVIYLISLCEEKLLRYYSLRPGLGTQMKL